MMSMHRMNASKLRELTVKLKCSLLPSTDVKAGIRNAGGDQGRARAFGHVYVYFRIDNENSTKSTHTHPCGMHFVRMM